jgi:hypothetical protein
MLPFIVLRRSLLPFILLLFVSGLTQAQTFISFGLQSIFNPPPCEVFLQTRLMNVPTSGSIFFQRSNDNQSTWQVIGSTTLSATTTPTEIEFINFTDANPYTSGGALYTNGATSLYYRAYVNPPSPIYSTTYAVSTVPAPPPTPGITISGIEPLNFGTQMDVRVTTTAPAPYLWYVNGTLVFTASSTSATINGGNNCNVLNTLMVKVANSCGGGTATASTNYTRSCGSGHFAISPNPAKGMITIDASAATDEELQAVPLSMQNKTAGNLGAGNLSTGSLAAGLGNKIYEVKIVDQFGHIRKVFSYPSGIAMTNVDLGGLETGLYIVQIYNKRSWVSQKLMVTK